MVLYGVYVYELVKYNYVHMTYMHVVLTGFSTITKIVACMYYMCPTDSTADDQCGVEAEVTPENLHLTAASEPPLNKTDQTNFSLPHQVRIYIRIGCIDNF